MNQTSHLSELQLRSDPAPSQRQCRRARKPSSRHNMGQWCGEQNGRRTFGFVQPPALVEEAWSCSVPILSLEFDVLRELAQSTESNCERKKAKKQRVARQRKTGEEERLKADGQRSLWIYKGPP